MKFKVALIGCGRIGEMHLSILSRHHNFEVRYIVDDMINPKDFLEYTIVSSKNMEHVLSSDIDAIVIASPTPTHENIIKKAITYNKSIFCEKPISINLSTLKSLKSLIESEAIKLQVGLNRRFDPDLKQLRNLIKKGEVGEVHVIKITNRDPKCPPFKFMKSSGGIFFDFNVHDFDMIKYLTGYDIIESYAVGATLILPQLKEINDLDTVLISLRLSNGALALIDCTRETNFGYDQRVEVFGSKGMLELNNISKTENLYVSNEMGSKKDLPHWSFIERYAASFKNELDAFHQYLSDSKIPSPASIDDIIDAIRVAEATQKSFDLNTPCIVD